MDEQGGTSQLLAVTQAERLWMGHLKDTLRALLPLLGAGPRWGSPLGVLHSYPHRPGLSHCNETEQEEKLTENQSCALDLKMASKIQKLHPLPACGRVGTETLRLGGLGRFLFIALLHVEARAEQRRQGVPTWDWVGTFHTWVSVG